MVPRKKFYRVKEAIALTHPDTGQLVVPNPTIAYPGNDPLVRKYPQFFESDEDRVEEASAAPGEKRHIPRTWGE